MNEIEKLIVATFKRLMRKVSISEYSIDKGNKLYFPLKRDGEVRISEQELRLLLVKELDNNSELDFQYAIEAPTMKTYSFTGENKRSGNFDLCIYKNGIRKHLIEFKSLNPSQEAYSKDFEKLYYDAFEDEDLENYFVQVITSSRDSTFKNIKNKYNEAIKFAIRKYSKEESKNKLSQIKFFLCDLDNKKIYRYKIKESGEVELIE